MTQFEITKTIQRFKDNITQAQYHNDPGKVKRLTVELSAFEAKHGAVVI
jgi:uncharacterized membrane protein (DUF106 family)